MFLGVVTNNLRRPTKTSEIKREIGCRIATESWIFLRKKKNQKSKNESKNAHIN